MYKFNPIVKHLVWGSETWLISSVPGNESIVASGPDKGKTINEIYGGPFPLLIKFIDAKDDLSIQVHPNDELALKRHNCKGKTEMWYVRKADKGASLLSGFKTRISPRQYGKMVAEGRITDVLGRYEIRQGDVFFLPAGRIHAIGGGAHIAEIQQTSDITYRIYDYNRPGLDGKPRELHTELAREAIDYSLIPDARTSYERVRNKESVLVQCPFFVTSLFDLDREYNSPLREPGSPLVAICLEGEGVLNGESIKTGDVFLITAEDGRLHAIPSAGGGLKLLTSFVPTPTK